MTRTRKIGSGEAEVAVAPKSRRAQMADVARLAGVSIATVSRALADSELISKDTRARVREIADSLNYAINVRAQNLRLQNHRAVGLVVPYDKSSHQQLTDPFFLSIVGAIADELTEMNYDVLLSRVDADHLDECASLVASERVLGLLVIGQWHRHEQLNRMALRGLPLVVWGAKLEAQSYCCVGSDNEDGGFQAAQHLLDQGCTRILFLGDPALPEVDSRYRGYARALAKRGIALDDRLVLDVPFAADVAKPRIERRVARGGFDSVFACSDLLGIAAMQSLAQAGKRVPDDVPIVGFDDVMLARMVHPSLTTVRQRIDQAAREMVAALQKQIDGERIASIELKSELVVRETSRAMRER